MNPTQVALSRKLERLTQRLDRKNLDPTLSREANEKASAELAALAVQLASLLPDPTFSVEERIEQLARLVPQATPNPELMEPDAVKLRRIKERLDELVSGKELTAEQKIAKLGQLLAQARAQLAA